MEDSVAGLALWLQAQCRGGFPGSSARGPRLPLPAPSRQLAQGGPPVGDFLPVRVTGTQQGVESVFSVVCRSQLWFRAASHGGLMGAVHSHLT